MSSMSYLSYQATLDAFAAIALQALLRTDEGDTKSVEDIAALAYEQAEAMMVERARRANAREMGR